VTGEGYGAIKLLGAAVTLLGVAIAQFARSGDPAREVESVGVVD
jgi:hypothetical protein